MLGTSFLPQVVSCRLLIIHCHRFLRAFGDGADDGVAGFLDNFFHFVCFFGGEFFEHHFHRLFGLFLLADANTQAVKFVGFEIFNNMFNAFVSGRTAGE